MRTLTCVVGIALVTLVLAGPTAAARVTTGAPDPVVMVRYTGTLDATREPFGDSPRGPNYHEARYRWSLAWRGRLSEIKKNASYRFEIAELSGTVRYVDRVSLPNADNRFDCTGRYVPKPGANPPLTVTYNPDNRGGIGVQVFRPISGDYLVPTNKTSYGLVCTGIFAGVLDPKDIVPPIFYFPLTGGTQSHDVAPYDFGPPGDRYRTILKESVKVGEAQPGAGTGAGPVLDPKDFFRRDLVRAVERLKLPCLGLALGFGAETAKALSSALGPASVTVAKVYGDLTAGQLSGASLPLCEEALKQIAIDFTIVKRDPPVSKATPTLSLPSCARWQGKARTYCRELRAAVTELVAAERKVVPVLERGLNATMKLTAARKTGKTQAVGAAQTAVSGAMDSLRSVRAAASAAGQRVASLIKAAGVSGKLTKAQSASTIDALLARLAKEGVSPPVLRQLVGGTLRPGPVSILAALQR